jgi:uncharacterized membrane protein (UPF0127 family)
MRYSWVAVSIGAVVACTIGIGIWLSTSMGGGQLDGSDGQPPLPMVQLRQAPGGPLEVEVADEPDERANGLSRRRGLASDQGMLFLFADARLYPFWMKDMRFPIDIIYLYEGTVTEVFPSVAPPLPGGVPATVQPTVPADTVLELFAGESARRGIEKGVYFQGLPSLR